MPPTRSRRPPLRRRERGESFPTFLKVLVPMFIMGLAIFQSIINRGHVDNNVIGALIFIGLGGTVGYVADRFIQAWLGLGNATVPNTPQQHDELEAPEDEPEPEQPERRRPRKRKSHNA